MSNIFFVADPHFTAISDVLNMNVQCGLCDEKGGS